MDIVRLAGIKQSTVYSLLKRYEDRGGLENKRRSGRQIEFADRDSHFLASKISLCLPAGQSVVKLALLYNCLTGKQQDMPLILSEIAILLSKFIV